MTHSVVSLLLFIGIIGNYFFKGQYTGLSKAFRNNGSIFILLVYCIYPEYTSSTRFSSTSVIVFVLVVVVVVVVTAVMYM